MDTLGLFTQYLHKFNLTNDIIIAIITLTGGIAFRAIQIILQKLPTKWKWINNKLTLSFINKCLSLIFGKTTMLYNAEVELSNDPYKNEIAHEKLKEIASEHITRNGGIMAEVVK